MILSELKKYAEEISVNHPHLEDDVRSLYFIAVYEVSEGAPEEYTCKLTVDDIESLIIG